MPTHSQHKRTVLAIGSPGAALWLECTYDGYPVLVEGIG